jgi:hypothetical protein
MNRDTLQSHILNGETSEQFTALLIWGLLGLILSTLLEMIRHKSKIKIKGGFNFIFWIKDNAIRLIVSLIAVIIGVSFSKDLIGIEVSNLGAISAGFCTDKIIEALIKFKSLTKISIWNKE